MKAPPFEFDHHAWLTDRGIRSLSPEERDAWFSMLCIMQDCDPIGTLTLNGKPYPVERLASALGRSSEVVGEIIFALLETGVASQDENGVIYSRRMVRDQYKREL